MVKHNEVSLFALWALRLPDLAKALSLFKQNISAKKSNNDKEHKK